MKNISCILFLLIFGISKSIQPKVDERIEFLSIVFRLAENPEYNNENAKLYVEEIHAYFDQYKNHELIFFAKSQRQNFGVSYDAVMSMAVHLEKKGNSFRLIKESNNNLDERWTKENAEKFVQLLNDFYKKTNFKKFFKDHQKQYEYAEKSFSNSLVNFDESWYQKFYGKKAEENFNIILGYGNGGGNYGPKTEKLGENKNVYAIMGMWKFNEQNLPVIDGDDYLPFIIHEFNHSFVNPILEKKYKDNQQLKTSAEIILDKQREIMENQAYGNWYTIVNESIVRAAVVKYMIDHNFPAEKYENEIKTQEFRGFLWVPDLVNVLNDFDKNRNQYQTLENYYPKIVDFFTETSKKIDQLKNNYEKKQPFVKSIQPFENNAQNVDYNTKFIIINFNEKMAGKGWSINLGKLGREHFPIGEKITYENDNTSLKMELIQLKPDTEYEFVLTGKRFRNKEGYPINNYTIKFKTSK